MVASHVLVLTKPNPSVYYQITHFCKLLIGGMTESYEQSNSPPIVAPEDYLSNKAKIAEAKALISAYEELNEVGKQSHDVLARELEQKIREGEQARYVKTLFTTTQYLFVYTPYRKLLLRLQSQ
jgi:hypothetical protein